MLKNQIYFSNLIRDILVFHSILYSVRYLNFYFVNIFMQPISFDVYCTSQYP